MRFHGLSESRVRRALRAPSRVEEGIAPASVAFVHISPPSARSEVWVLALRFSGVEVSGRRSALRILSAWRYPGRTKPGTPLPDSILAEVAEGDDSR